MTIVPRPQWDVFLDLAVGQAGYFTTAQADELGFSAGSEGIRPLARAEYDRLVELGLLDGERVELLHGVIIPMRPQGAPHASTVGRMNRLLLLALGDRAEVRPQLPWAATGDSEPEPDLAIVPCGDWDREHPGTAHLLVEITATSQHRDREIKRDLYATSGVPEYWLVDLQARAIEVYRDPSQGRYRSLQTWAGDDLVAMLAFPDVQLRVGDVLPRA